MNIKTTLIGTALLALLAAGAWWAQSPSPTPVPAPVAPAPAAGDDALPDVTLAAGTTEIGATRITLSVTPNPPVALAMFRVRVRAEANGSPAAIEAGRVSFEMAMPMGDHRYTLVPGEQGWQEAAVVLPT